MTGAVDSPPDQEELEQLAAGLPGAIRFGTSTWTYPGWKGLIYHQQYPKTGAAARMLEEYARFPLFRTVGIDSSFYAPPTPEMLQSYSLALPPSFPCVSKVWDQITVHTHAKPRQPAMAGQENPDFLNPDIFRQEVLDPYREHFGDHMGPFVFEFQAIGRDARMTAQEFADRLDSFFTRLPTDVPYAVEVRNPEFLTPPYFAVLRLHEVGHVFNSWTRMPAIGEQLELPESVTAPFIVCRALLRPGRTYSEAVDRFAPYDRIREANQPLRRDIIRLIERALELRIPAYVIVNNRAEGSAPLTITAVARRWRSRGG
ncbi:MAG: DUF72 domain-containing protein [Gemmatimonadales bacterium]